MSIQCQTCDVEAGTQASRGKLPRQGMCRTTPTPMSLGLGCSMLVNVIYCVQSLVVCIYHLEHLCYISGSNALINIIPYPRPKFHRHYRGFSRWPCWISAVELSGLPCWNKVVIQIKLSFIRWRAETMKQFCMKIDLISKCIVRAAMTSYENAQ